MSEDQHRFLTLLGASPARLTAEQVTWVLNCQPHDMPVLVAARLLKPLEKSATQRREVLSRVRIAGTGQGSDLAGQGHQHGSPTR